MNKMTDYQFYETPDWAVKELFKVWQPEGDIFEPCVGGWAIAVTIQRLESKYCNQFRLIATNDLNPDTNAGSHLDAADPKNWSEWHFDNVITNPPYGSVGPKILKNALTYSKTGVAMYLRGTFLEPCKGRKWLKDFPPNFVIHLPRYSFRTSRKSRTDSSSCSWYVWDKRYKCTQKIIQIWEDEIEGFYASAEKGAAMAFDKALEGTLCKRADLYKRLVFNQV